MTALLQEARRVIFGIEQPICLVCKERAQTYVYQGPHLDYPCRLGKEKPHECQIALDIAHDRAQRIKLGIDRQTNEQAKLDAAIKENGK